MIWILCVILGILLLATALLVGLYFFSATHEQAKAGRRLEDMAGVAEPYAKAGLQGIRVCLVPAVSSPWHHPHEAGAIHDVLLGNGFVEAGRYLLNGHRDDVVALYLDESEHLVAFVGDTAQHPPVVEVAAVYEGGKTVSYINQSEKTMVDYPGWQKNVCLPSANIDELLAAAFAGLPTQGRLTYSIDELPALFEEEILREKVWRAQRGGYTLDEIRRVVSESPQPVSEEELRALWQQKQHALWLGLDEMLFHELARVRGTTIEELMRWGERLVAVHAMVDVPTLASYLLTLRVDARAVEAGGLDRERRRLEDEIRTQLQTQPAIEVFPQMAAEIGADNRLIKLGRVEDPIPADFYVLPLIPRTQDKGIPLV